VAHILSQEEVDALLRNFQEEEDVAPSPGGRPALAPPIAQAGESPVRLYDFRRPNRISKEQLRFLTTLHATYAFSFAGVLSGHLRTLVEMSVVSVEEYSYGEWIKGLRDTTSLFPFAMTPLDGSGVIEMDPRMVLGFVDRLLGGRGEIGDEERELTHLETTVVSRVIEDGLKMLGDAWKEVVDVQPVLQGHERQPHLLRLLADTEPVIVVHLDVRIRAKRGRMILCYPFVPLERGLANVTGVFTTRPLERTAVPQAANWIHASLAQARVPVAIELGGGTVTIGEFIHLRVGDVVRLKTALDEPVVVTIAGRAKNFGRPGRIERRLAVEVIGGCAAGMEGDHHE
jgi:flagellar motor switch protein FliM